MSMCAMLEGFFSIEPFSGKLSALRELDRERQELYILTVEARRLDVDKRSKRDIAMDIGEEEAVLLSKIDLDLFKQVFGQNQVIHCLVKTDTQLTWVGASIIHMVRWVSILIIMNGQLL